MKSMVLTGAFVCALTACSSRDSIKAIKEMVRSDSSPEVRGEACRLVALPALPQTTAFYEHLLEGKVDSLPEAGPCLQGLISLWARPEATSDFKPDKAAWEATVRLLPGLAKNPHPQAESAFHRISYITSYAPEALNYEAPWLSDSALPMVLVEMVRNTQHNEGVQEGALRMLKALRGEAPLLQLLSEFESNKRIHKRIERALYGGP